MARVCSGSSQSEHQALKTVSEVPAAREPHREGAAWDQSTQPLANRGGPGSHLQLPHCELLNKGSTSHTCTPLHTCVHTCTHTHVHTCGLTQCSSHVHMLVYGYVHAHAHTGAGAHTPTGTHTPGADLGACGAAGDSRQRLPAWPWFPRGTGLTHVDTWPAGPSSSRAAPWPPFRRTDWTRRGLGHASRETPVLKLSESRVAVGCGTPLAPQTPCLWGHLREDQNGGGL